MHHTQKRSRTERWTPKFLGITASLITLAATFFGAGAVFAQAGSTATSTGYCSGASATVFGGTMTFSSLVQFLVCLLEQSIVPFLFAVALVVFIWGMVKFISTEETSEREEGKQFMLWGIIALAVMFSVWGLVALLGQTFGVHDVNVIPQLPVNP